MTLKIRSMSPKSIQLFIMSKCYIHANLVRNRQLVHEILCTFWLKFGSLIPTLTLKNRSRSPKSKQLFIISQCYIHANVVEICQPVHEIWCTQALLGFYLAVSHAVTLKIRSRSPKPNQLFIMSKCYIHANLVKIHPTVPIMQTRKCHADTNANADANRIRTKNNVPLPFSGGHSYALLKII